MKKNEKLFKKYWHMLCHRTELPSVGDFLKFETPIGDIVVFNDDGELVAFDNRCPHRGALIYQTKSGNQANTCRYHGWTYKSGIMLIPNVEKFGKCDISRIDINKYKVDWCGDFMFVAVEPETDLYTQLDGVAHYIENISFNINGRLDLNAYKYESTWQVAIENALEPYHIGMVHPNTLAKLKLDDGLNTFYGLNSVWQARIGNSKIKKMLKKLRQYFNIDYGYEGYMFIYMFPFTMISSTYGYSYSVQNFFPSQIEYEKTNFMSRLLACNLKDDKSKRIMQSFFDSTREVNRMVFEEDHSICKTMPADSWSSDPLEFCSDEEIKISHFRNLCKEAMK